MEDGTLMIYAVVAVFCGFISMAIASGKGLSAGAYFLVGALLGVLGILLAAVAKPAVSGVAQQLTPAPAKGWWPDPTGRFDGRYFDGRWWTRHVTRGAGLRFEDPL